MFDLRTRGQRWSVVGCDRLGGVVTMSIFGRSRSFNLVPTADSAPSSARNLPSMTGRGLESCWADDPGRDPRNNRVGRHVLGHDRTCTDDRAVTDGHAWHDCYSGAEPDLAADDDRRRNHVRPPVRVHPVVQRRNDAAVPDKCVVTDGDAPGVLEGAAHVDEYPLAESEVLPELAVERREDRHRFI